MIFQNSELHSWFEPFSYQTSDIEKLVEGTLPQRRVLDLAPGIGDIVGSDGREHLTRIIQSSMEY